MPHDNIALIIIILKFIHDLIQLNITLIYKINDTIYSIYTSKRYFLKYQGSMLSLPR